MDPHVRLAPIRSGDLFLAGARFGSFHRDPLGHSLEDLGRTGLAELFLVSGIERLDQQIGVRTAGSRQQHGGFGLCRCQRVRGERRCQKPNRKDSGYRDTHHRDLLVTPGTTPAGRQGPS